MLPTGWWQYWEENMVKRLVKIQQRRIIIKIQQNQLGNKMCVGESFNNELEQKIMTVVNKLLPFKQRTSKSINKTENPKITELKTKCKQMYQRA